MNFITSRKETAPPCAASSPNLSKRNPNGEQLDEALQALAIPFDLVVVQWRVPCGSAAGAMIRCELDWPIAFLVPAKQTNAA
jgi:hypothetical protein